MEVESGDSICVLDNLLFVRDGEGVFSIYWKKPAPNGLSTNFELNKTDFSWRNSDKIKKL